MNRNGDAVPIYISEQEAERIGRLLARALNRNQTLILKAISNRQSHTLTSLLREVERESRIPISTLKLNARILKELQLVQYGREDAGVRLTAAGKIVMNLML